MLDLNDDGSKALGFREKDKEDGGLPWGVIFVVSALITVIAVVGVVLYRRKIVLCKEKQNTEN